MESLSLKGGVESLEFFQRKLELKAAAEEQRYYMKARQEEMKKEREHNKRQQRAAELQSQISIVGGQLSGFNGGNQTTRHDYTVS